MGNADDTDWKRFKEDRIPRACIVIIIMIIVVIFVACIVGLIVWDNSGNGNGNHEVDYIPLSRSTTTSSTTSSTTTSPVSSTTKRPRSTRLAGVHTIGTLDDFTFSQRTVAQAGQSAENVVSTSNGTIVGGTRQVFLTPPVNSSSQVVINRGELYYEYKDTRANGFEVRWLDYITKDKPTVKPINLSKINSFSVNIEKLDFTSGNTFTLQMDVLDVNGVEGSVVNIVNSPQEVQFSKRNFLGNGPGQRLDFSQIVGIWLGGDFRASSGQITLGPLMLNK